MPLFRAFLVVLVLPGLAWADELKTLAGKNISGSLSAITETEMILKTDAGTVTTPLKQVLSLDLRPVKTEPVGEKSTQVELVDDSRLLCTDLAFEASEVKLTLSSGATLNLPLSAIVSIQRDIHDPAVKKQWERFSKQKVRRDRIFILRDGELNPIEGTLGDIDPKAQAIQFTREGTTTAIAVLLDRVTGLAYYRTDPPAEAAMCKVIDQHGNNLAAAGLQFDGMILTVTTTFGAKLPLKSEVLARLDFNLGRLTYLSDLDGKVSASPLLGGFNPVRKDTNLDGNPITLLDRQFVKGLSTYAGVELEYQLGGKYKDLKALLGADPRVAEEGQGKVTVTIYCDGEKRKQYEVSTKEMTTVNVNVKEVNTLRIVVTGPNFTPFAGHATLADARVSQ